MHYKIIIEGNNFLVEKESGYKVVGFFTTFVVDARSIEEINEPLISLLNARLANDSIKTTKTFLTESYALIDAVYSAGEDEYRNVRGGFTFFNLSLLGRARSYFKLFYLKVTSPNRVLKINKSIDA